MIILYQFYQIMLPKSGYLHNVHVHALITGIIVAVTTMKGQLGEPSCCLTPPWYKSSTKNHLIGRFWYFNVSGFDNEIP